MLKSWKMYGGKGPLYIFIEKPNLFVYAVMGFSCIQIHNLWPRNA